MNTVYLNNKFVPLHKARISILDRGFLYGDGLFETMRAYEGVIFLLKEHIERLLKSLKALGIRPEINKPKIQKIIYALLDKNRLKNAYVKIIITRGKSSGLLIPLGNSPPTVAIYILPYRPRPRDVYEKGITVAVSETILNEKSQIAGRKTLNYLDNILCRYEAGRKNFADSILVNTKGFITEATSSNIFLVKRKKIYTPCPECGILPGITRAEIIRLAKKILKYKIKEGFIKKDIFYNADEIFLTNSLAEIVPVVKIDSRVVGEGAPGAVTKELMGLFRNSVSNYCIKGR